MPAVFELHVDPTALKGSVNSSEYRTFPHNNNNNNNNIY